MPPLARDVTVNLMANLLANAVAAAGGYLLLVATGVFKGNDTLVRVALIVTIPIVILGTLVLATARKRDRDAYLVVAATLIGPACMVAAVVVELPVALRIALVAAGAAVVFAGWYTIRRL